MSNRNWIVREAQRLRQLGYDWDVSFNIAELLEALAAEGFCAMISEDVMPEGGNSCQGSC